MTPTLKLFDWLLNQIQTVNGFGEPLLVAKLNMGFLGQLGQI